MTDATVLGYPRIGARRELKFATEDYWAGRADADALAKPGAELRAAVWHELRDAGVDAIPSNTFSYYDQVLDTSVLVDAVPDRYRHLTGFDRYFAMARGVQDVPPLEMTKWFDTNYHYLVPELGPGTRFRLADAAAKPLAEYREAKALGIETRPVLVGPLTFLLLAKPPADAPDGFRPLDLLDGLIDVYAELLDRLAGPGAAWVQFDEPALVADRTAEELAALARAYARLGRLPSRPRAAGRRLLRRRSATRLRALARTPGRGGRPGLRRRARQRRRPRRRRRAAAQDARRGRRGRAQRVAGRPGAARWPSARRLLGLADRLVVSTSCSLLHVPLDLDAETSLDPGVRERLAFARQKVAEVVALGRALSEDAPARRRGARARGTAQVDASGPGAPRLARRTRGAGDRSAAARRAAGARSACRTCPPRRSARSRRPPEIRRARADRRAGRIDRGGVRAGDAGRDRPRHRAAGGARAGRARARRAGAQRHGAVLRRAARRVRRDRARLGAVVRHAVRPPADPLRRRGAPRGR